MRNNKNFFLGLIFGIFLIGLAIRFYGYEDTLQLWKIPLMKPNFADFRTIAGGAYSQSLGYNPQIYNPGDPWGRPMNYPRIWEILYVFGLSQQHTIFFGVGFIILFFCSFMFFLSPNIDKTTSLALFGVIFSPAILLGLERGNTDLFIFFVLSVGIYFYQREKIFWKCFAVVMMLFGFILKLFPIFGFTLFLRSKRSFRTKLAFFVIFVLVLYAVTNRYELLLIRRATPMNTELSYGFPILWMKFYSAIPLLGKLMKAFSYLIIFLVFGLVVKSMHQINLSPNEGRYLKCLDAFRLGSGIYIGTFLIGTNSIYRLVFLLFVIPQLIIWIKGYTRSYRFIAIINIGGIFFSTWYTVVSSLLKTTSYNLMLSFMLNQAFHWIIFISLVNLLSLSSPIWVKSSILQLEAKMHELRFPYY